MCVFSYPPLEGEGRLALSAAKCETGWGGEATGRDLAYHHSLLRHPTPLATRATLPLQGRVQQARTPPQSRDGIRPRFANSFAPKERAQGRPGARCTRGLACQCICKENCTRAYRFSGSSPAFPAQWSYGLSCALPGETRLACHRRPRDTKHHRELDTCQLGRQDHTILPYAQTLFVNSVLASIAPRTNVRDDRDTPLFESAGCQEISS